MPYITATRIPRQRQLTFDDMIYGIDPSSLVPLSSMFDTVTWCPHSVSAKLKAKINFSEMGKAIREFICKYENLIEEPNKKSLYYSFKIPKRSGGLRQIDAPQPPLMEALYDLKSILENQFLFTYHTTAFAYVHGRCNVSAVKRHQRNNSRWVLKTDLSKFFPHTTPEFLFRMLYQTFPLCEFVKDKFDREDFERAMSLCFLDGGLPQGTPTSPMLTNQMMIPIDHEINKMCHAYSPHLCYTRYADDMDISSEFSFRWTDVLKQVGDILKSFDAPFEFNKDKIHYGSTSGRNWMLGVMLNKDGNITVGHENKKTFKNSLFAFGNSIRDGNPWTVEDAQHLQGLVAYYKMVEGETIDKIVQSYSERFGFDLLAKMKQIIRGESVTA